MSLGKKNQLITVMYKALISKNMDWKGSKT